MIRRAYFYAKRLFNKALAASAFSEDKVAREEDEKFDNLEINTSEALEKLNPILMAKYGREFDFQSDSIHWILWAGISNLWPINRILEIGTFDGEGTHILGKLFPQAEIITLDLPENDPILRASYGRESEEKYETYKKKQKENLKLSNIKLLNINSFFLTSHVSGPFDLIWVDGGHLFPEVAWDICNAWNMCSPGGFILCDDVLPTQKPISTKYVSSESYKVLLYLKDRSDSGVTLFLKRRNPLHYASVITRKYVALIRKLV